MIAHLSSCLNADGMRTVALSSYVQRRSLVLIAPPPHQASRKYHGVRNKRNIIPPRSPLDSGGRAG